MRVCSFYIYMITGEPHVINSWKQRRNVLINKEQERLEQLKTARKQANQQMRTLNAKAAEMQRNVRNHRVIVYDRM